MLARNASPVLRVLDSTPMPAALDAIPYATLPTLHAGRTWLDALIVEWVATLAPTVLSSRLVYANMKGETFARRIDGLLTHLFNHQTHHRGQVTTLLSQAGVEVGVTDLVTLVPNED